MADTPTRCLPDDEPAQCGQVGCRRDHAAEVEYATNHMADSLPWARAVLGLDGEYVQTVRPGQECIIWDPAHKVVVSLSRDFAGIAMVDDGTVRLLADDAPPGTLSGLRPIIRAVTIARLRAWANQLEDTPEVHTLAGDRIP